MSRTYDDALLLYLSHCNAHRRFFVHPHRELSETIDGDWHLRNQNGLIAIINTEGRVEYFHGAVVNLLH